MDTDFTFWLVLSMLVLLIITSITVLIRACIGDRCGGGIDRLFGLVAATEEDPETGPRDPVVYVISPQMLLDNQTITRSGRIRSSRQHRWRESPPTEGAYSGLCSTPPPPYDPPPAYHTLLISGGRRRRKSTSSEHSVVSVDCASAVAAAVPGTAGQAQSPEVHVSVVVLEASAHWL